LLKDGRQLVCGGPNVTVAVQQSRREEQSAYIAIVFVILTERVTTTHSAILSDKPQKISRAIQNESRREASATLLDFVR
jgi:hypothetical protein